MRIFENDFIYIDSHESSIPWLKIFPKREIKEFSQCNTNEKEQILKSLNVIEKLMLEFYNPTKINIASFGNYLPHLHFHIMARFENDSHFPEPMWGVQQREETLVLPSFDEFIKRVQKVL